MKRFEANKKWCIKSFTRNQVENDGDLSPTRMKKKDALEGDDKFQSKVSSSGAN